MEEDAYDYLKTFFQKLEVKSPTNERILASIFLEQLSDPQVDVVNLKMVLDAIAKMNSQLVGNPSSNESTNSSYQEQANSAAGDSDSYYRKEKRLYRDVESRVFAGICSGLGYYYRSNPVLFRLLFVLLFFITSGSFLVVYIVLWIVVPKADTLGKKMRMTGDEYEPPTDTAMESTLLPERNGFLLFIKRLFGIFLIIIGIATIVSTVLATIFFVHVYPDIPSFIPPFIHGLPIMQFNVNILYVIIFSAIAVAVIPLFMLLTLGISLVFDDQRTTRTGWIISFFIWLLALAVLVFSTLRLAADFKDTASVEFSNTISLNSSDTIKLCTAPSKYDLKQNIIYQINQIKYLRSTSDSNEEVFLVHPDLNILRSDSDESAIIYNCKAKGNGIDMATNYAESFKYNFKPLRNDSLIFDPYIVIPDVKEWQSQSLEIDFKIPDQKVIYIDESVLPILHQVYSASSLWINDMAGKYWKMTADGLIEVHP